MAVGKKKYTGKSNSSVRKVVSNSFSREKQVIIVLISLVVLIAVIAVLYPMLTEKGVTGKATASKMVTDVFCSEKDTGKVYSPSALAVDNYKVSAICVGGVYGLLCDQENSGFVKTIKDQFDVLCSPNPVDQTLKWVECNTDGIQGTSGYVSKVDEGTIINNHYLCANYAPNFESWYVCSKEVKLAGSDVIDWVDSLSIGKDKAYTCDGTAWQLCDSSKKGTITGVDQQSLCYSSSDKTAWDLCWMNGIVSGAGDDVLKYLCQDDKWHDCSLPENNGVVGKNKNNYCDGTQWVNCDSSAVGISSNDKYYCAGNKFWQECKTENSFSSDYKALCKAGKWQALPAAVEVPPKGYSWEVAPVVQQTGTFEGGATIQKIMRIGSSQGVVGDQNKKYFCPSTNPCPSGSYKSDEPTLDYCYAENTLTPNFAQPSNILCTLENNQGVWDVCSADLPADYKLYKNKYLCVVQKVGASGAKAFWDKCDQDKVSGDNDEYHCDPATSTWTKCTSTLDGDATVNENFVCSAGQWTTMFKVGVEKNNLFEVRVQENGKAKNIETGKSTLGGITLCDKDTENIKSKATVCYTDKKKTIPEVTVSVLSLHSLQGSNQPLANVDSVNDLLYIYDEADQKSVSVVKIIHPQASSVQISETVLANNFKAGRRLAVEVDGHYYLLGQVPAGSLEMSKLQLISLPSLSATPVNVLASDQYQFEIQAKKVLALKYVGTTITFSVGKVTQALAGAVQDHNLAGEYEVQFSKEQPVRLQDLDNKVLVPCLSDAPNDPLLMQLCLDDETQQPFISLERDVLVKTQLEGKDVALLYHWDETTSHKQASVFYLQTVSGVSESPTTFDYNDFNSNLAIAGNRVAVEFEGQLYLIKHEGNILSLPKVSLLSYTGTETAYPAASQSEKQVEFVVDGGKVYLTRSFSSPPPPFGMYGKTTIELLTESVDLVNELSTSMSSQVPVNIVGPINYGVIGRDTGKNGDVLGDKNSFKIKGSISNQQLLLKYHTPFVQSNILGNTLFYYYSAELKDGNRVKSVQMYTLYNLSDLQQHPTKEHLYDDAFIDIFTNQGKQIALAFNSSFYLLGYAGKTLEQNSFFRFENLTLTTLDGSAKFDPIVLESESKAEFNVPEGKVMVSVDISGPTISFSKQDIAGLKKEAEAKATQEAKEAATVQFDPVVSYKYMLVPGKIVDVVNSEEKLANGKYEICDKGVFKDVITDKVQLCKDGVLYKTLNVKDFVGDNGLLFYYQYQWIDNVTKFRKQVFLQQTVNLASDPLAFSWLKLTENFKQKQYPVLKWDDQWYELTGNSPELYSLGLSSLSGAGYCDVKVYDGEKGKQNGTIYCSTGAWESGKWKQISQSKLLKIEQELDENSGDILFTIKPLTAKLVTATGFNVSDTVMIIPSLDKPEVYQLKVNTLLATLVSFRVYTDDDQLLTLVVLPKSATKTILLPNGEIINVHVLEDPKTEAPIVAVSK